MDKEKLSLGDEMKAYENKYRSYVPKSKDKVYVVRCDGVAFSNLCKNFDKPFDDVFRTAMKEALLAVCAEVQGMILGYTQSDEITILFRTNACDELYFGGNIQKIASTVASTATNAFNKALMKYGKGQSPYAEKVFEGKFDGRLWEMPMDIAYKTIVWRMNDCYKNAVQMVARCYYSNSELYKKTVDVMTDMLAEEKGVNIHFEYTKQQLYGVIAYKKEVVLNQGMETECTRKKWFTENAKDFEMKKYFQNELI